MWHLIWTHYAAAVIGFIIGLLTYAVLASGSDQNARKNNSLPNSEQDIPMPPVKLPRQRGNDSCLN